MESPICPTISLALPISSLPDKPQALQFVDWVLRGISQVVFVSNPISGILILVGLLVITKNISWEEAINNDWRKTGDWQPGWEYTI